MHKRLLLTVAALAACTGFVNAQSVQRRATMRGGGDPNRGKCTIEVVVDGAAEVEIRGDNAVLRNLTGQPAQWRRFECNSVMPPSPADFRFAGVDGRGRQDLVRDPRQGGVAVVRIEDRQGGSEGYTFDIFWSNAGYGGGRFDERNPPPPPPGRYDERDRDSFYRGREEFYRGQGWRGRIFQRVREDLEHVQAETYPRGGDQWRLQRTQRELDELQSMWANGRYDDRQLDDVINALQRVLNDNRMSRRNRDVLSDDLSRLRDFRERHEQWRGR